MGRFILRFRGGGPIPAQDRDRIRATPNVTVLDSSPRMLLIDAPEPTAKTLGETMVEWVVTQSK